MQFTSLTNDPRELARFLSVFALPGRFPHRDRLQVGSMNRACGLILPLVILSADRPLEKRLSFSPLASLCCLCPPRESPTVAMAPYALARGVKLRVANPPPFARTNVNAERMIYPSLLPMLSEQPTGASVSASNAYSRS